MKQETSNTARQVVCLKTGRWWPCRDDAHARRIARDNGLVDYETSNS